MTIAIVGEAISALESLALSQGLTQAEVIRRAILTEAYIRDAMTNGGQVQIRDAGGQVRDVVFR